jgi:hypothetical protein
MGQQLATAGGQHVVIFIDDLDRCKPDKVVEVLEAINIVLCRSGFGVVIGMVSDMSNSSHGHK